ncbi:type VI secretion system ImpA family N-terminal domain-containing protein [Glaciimonas sp. Gout2]|uniref:type VI secretion system protein TssA n=1 Tax=unclassified Glaciimonas TaxID=2644401 RepID=UPI002B232F66|nr:MULTISPECIES: type VI secretion system ImpA family N-terminal domain-containing protein [unclassified Glaciimonas]MEB0014166.1 type VI secretion system ImpA family N-terminal domain-containing protein [Glaciimonas sp. Cout2]MEB0083441.1 type VI secretion system ImpA family N-terminal domain-containing protein [Glaciimonas sp. Gout2]
MNPGNDTSLIRYGELLAPICVDQPCGPNLEYDPTFLLLQNATATKSDAQFGDFVGTPDPINWSDVERNTHALLLRTKDIRLIILLMRSRINLDGAEGLRDGLALLKSMLECYSEQIHPSFTFEDHRDPVMRANALAALAEQNGVLSDLRNIALPKVAGVQLQLRDIEKSSAMPRIKNALMPEAINRILKELSAKRDRHVLALADAMQLGEKLIEKINVTLGDAAPNLDPLRALLQPFGWVINQQQTNTPKAMMVKDEQPTLLSHGSVQCPQPDSTLIGPDQLGQLPPTCTVTRSANNSGSFIDNALQPTTDRWSALAKLQDVRNWFEENEPSSPVIVLLRQGERMVGKRFSELVDIIPSDLLAKWDETDI